MKLLQNVFLNLKLPSSLRSAVNGSQLDFGVISDDGVVISGCNNWLFLYGGSNNNKGVSVN